MLPSEHYRQPNPDLHLIEQMQAYLEAHNRHDVEAAMSFYVEDARFELVGEWVKVGKETIRGELEEWDAVTNNHLTFYDIKVSPDRADFQAIERDDWSRELGIEEFHYDSCSMVFRGGLIAEVRAHAAAESEKAFAQKWQAFLDWASKERGDALARLMPGGEFIQRKEIVPAWLDLLREWRASRKVRQERKHP